MSIFRLVARIAAICAFNNFGREPFPTIAGNRVFDSKLEPFEEMKNDLVYPTIVAYTDYDRGHWNKGSGIHSDRILSITIELLITQWKRGKGVGNDAMPNYTVSCPATDSELESSLDMFEVQALRSLSAGNSASNAFSYIIPSYDSVVSRRGASWEGGQRLAARQITIEGKALRDPISGTIPPAIEAFFTDLDTMRDYAERMPFIREMMMAPSALVENDRMRLAVGWSDEVATIVGRPTGVVSRLPINYGLFDAGGVRL